MTALLALLRELPDVPRHAVPPPEAWPRLLDEADVHGLSALLHHHLAERAPPAQHARLLHASHAATARALKLNRLLGFVLDGLKGLRVTPVLLKGIGLASRVWPAWQLRPSGDVDVLVAPHELDACRTFLLAEGFAKYEDPGEDDPEAHHHHEGFSGPRGIVEVHYKALAGPGGGALEGPELLARCRRASLEGRPVRYLPPEEELVYLGSHAAQHLFQRVAWLYDLKLLVRGTSGLDWDRVVEVASAAHLRSATYAALVLAADALGVAVPERALSKLAPTRAHRRLVNAAFTPDRLASASLALSTAAPALRALLADTPARAAQHLVEGATRRARRVLRSDHS